MLVPIIITQDIKPLTNPCGSVIQLIKSKFVTGSYHILAAKFSNKREVVCIIDIAVAHKQQVFFTYNLLYASWHLVTKQTFLLSFVHELRQLLQTVLPLSHAVQGKQQHGF